MSALPSLRRCSSLALLCAGIVFPRLAIAEPDEAQLKKAYDAASPAVVRVEAAADRGHAGVGVIVTPEGHVLLHATPHLNEKPLLFFLPGGKAVPGVFLGWSGEWDVSLAKITDSGPWPFAPLDGRPTVPRIEEPCVAVGYVLGDDAPKLMPEQRVGVVRRVGSRTWFSSSVHESKPGEPYFSFCPIFDLDGNLLGTTAKTWAGKFSDHVHAHQIKSLWSELLNSTNLDKKRLFAIQDIDESRRPYAVEAPAAGSKMSGEEKAIACTVKLMQKSGTWSGVVISPDGYIATCVHGGQMAGDQVKIEFANGRDAVATIVGANAITDIALAKITEPGPWPYAHLADTSRARADAPCWVVGYPFNRIERAPLVRKTTIVMPDNEEWSYQLATSASHMQYSGDSGGGVFDAQGRLLSIIDEKNADTIGRGPRVETFRRQWDALAGKK